MCPSVQRTRQCFAGWLEARDFPVDARRGEMYPAPRTGRYARLRATGCKVRQRTVTPPGRPTPGSIPGSPTTFLYLGLQLSMDVTCFQIGILADTCVASPPRTVVLIWLFSLNSVLSLRNPFGRSFTVRDLTNSVGELLFRSDLPITFSKTHNRRYRPRLEDEIYSSVVGKISVTGTF